MSDTQFNLATVIDDIKKVITNPVGFYRQMPTEGGYANPLIFVVVVAVITGLLISLTSLIGMSNAMMAGGMAFAAIFIFPIMAIIGSFIAAAVLFIIWKLMGSEKNYETAYRCVAYSFAIMPIVTLLSFIPYIGTIIKTLWTCFLLYVASIEVHKLKAQTAKIVFAVLAVIGLLYGIASEHTFRSFQSTIENGFPNGELPAIFDDLENIEDLSPEEAGEKVGEFLRGLENSLNEQGN